MTINALSIQRFTREGDGVALRANEETHPINGFAQELSQELKNAFVGKAGKQFGQFDRDIGSFPLAAWLRDYVESKQSFPSMVSRFAEHFHLQLVRFDSDFDGYILILHETLADEDSVYLYVIQHEGGLFVDGDMRLAQSQNLDVRGLRMGMKISLTGWQAEGEEAYLSLLRSRGDKPLTDSFLAATGFSDPEDTVAQTNAFLELVEKYSTNLEQEQAAACKRKVADFCISQDKEGRKIDVASVSEQIDEEVPAAFERFVIEQAPEAPQQFYADRKQMRNFVRISGRSDLLSLSFSSECLGQTVVYDAQTDTLLLKDIPSALKARLIKHVTGT